MSASDAQAKAPWPSLLPWLGWAVVVVLLDQLTKVLILQTFAHGDSVPYTEFFNLVRVHNHGAAFSFLAGAGGWQRWFFTALAFGASGFIVWMLRSHPGQRLFALAMSSILGGALGNVIDRIVHGYVVDFLDFYWGRSHFPAFNLADCAITLGAMLLIWDEWQRMKQASRTSAAP